MRVLYAADLSPAGDEPRAGDAADGESVDG
jgi:hypothetical protein